MFTPFVCQSLNVMFYVYTRFDSWKTYKAII